MSISLALFYIIEYLHVKYLHASIRNTLGPKFDSSNSHNIGNFQPWLSDTASFLEISRNVMDIDSLGLMLLLLVILDLF